MKASNWNTDIPLSGVEVYPCGLGESAMRIPDTALKCVGYVCEAVYRDAEGRPQGDPYATGFFVTVPCESAELKDQEMYYFITAKHVANDLKERDIYFQVNRKGGGTTHEILRIAPVWFLHPTDKNADIAVIQVALNAYTVDLAPIQIHDFGMPDRLKDLNIGIGDEVHSIGLFSPSPGNESNTPIVRFGNVSMMANEPIQTDLGYTEMYLVEARSIGGMSGSPVFVRPTFAQNIGLKDGSAVRVFSAGTGQTLLGMAQGHWDIREEEINSPHFTQDRKKGVNYGVALVVPAFKIHETIYQPGLVAMRKQQEQSVIRRQQSVPGSDSPKENTEALITKQDFEDALKKASRKIAERN